MSSYKINRRWVITTPKIWQMHLWEAVEEAQRNFKMAQREGKTFRLSGVGQSKISSKKWRKNNQ
jgi:hypothetical protein